SKGTGVFLDVSPNDMYGQIMSQPDEMIEILFVNCTLLPLEKIAEYMRLENPRNAKMKLAFEITKLFHGNDTAHKAQAHFANTVQKEQI
ncbi:MAG TPA: tyrosine--tRNA ligase, partial [candidate division WWE3 bacterium]|nr:tyrosine--tRNA ligase [candidate division WWE3 bacterium]